MFVKFVRVEFEDDGQTVKDTSETTYECHIVTRRDCENGIVFDMEGDFKEGCISHIVDYDSLGPNGKVSVFLMNDKGRTIDSYGVDNGYPEFELEAAVDPAS